MIDIAEAHVSSSAPAPAFFERWADMNSWTEWSPDVEWIRLDGPFTAGTTGVMKPKGGPKVPFVIDRLTPGLEFIDVSRLLGAKLTVDHQVTGTPDGGCRVDVRYTMTGPLARIWALILGKGLSTSAQPDLESLARVAERASATP